MHVARGTCIPDNPPYFSSESPSLDDFSLCPPFFDYRNLFHKSWPKMMIFYSDNTFLQEFWSITVIN